MNHTIIAVTRREIGRIWQFKPYLMTLTLLPALVLTLFAVIFYKGTPNNLPIALVDYDNTPLSRKISAIIDATPEVNILFEATSTDEAERLIREGKVGAMVIIPNGFESDIMGLKTANISTYISGANILENGLISKGLMTVIETFSIATQIQILTSQGLGKKQAIAQAMPIRFDKHALFNPYTNYSYYLSPSFMPMMILIFTVLSTIFSIGSELRYSTAGEWLASAQGSISVAIIGKLIPIFIAMILFSTIMFILLFEVIGVPLRGNIWILISGCILFILAYISVAIFIIALTADMRLAMSLAGGYSVMAFSFSGLTFPTLAMHKAIQWFSHLFPFTYFTDIMIDQALRGAPIGYSFKQTAYMMIFLLLPLTVIHRLKRISCDSRYWSKI